LSGFIRSQDGQIDVSFCSFARSRLFAQAAQSRLDLIRLSSFARLRIVRLMMMSVKLPSLIRSRS
jgi:hypothetical protein